VDYKHGSRQLRKQWDKFIRRLIKHEKHHGKIVLDVARSFERNIKRARGRVANECKDLRKSLDRKLDPLVATYLARQRRFDIRENRRYSRITQAQISLLRTK